VSHPITTKSLASNGGLEEILKKIESAGSLEESLLALGSTDFSSTKPLALTTSTLPRLNNDPHVFLGLQQKETTAKQGEKRLLIPDYVNLGTYDKREKEQEIGNNSSGAKIVIRSARGKPKLKMSPFLCRSLQTRELCTSSFEQENCQQPLPPSLITWLTQ